VVPSSTDNTHFSSRPKLEALPVLTFTLDKYSFRGSEEPSKALNQQDKNIVENPYDTLPKLIREQLRTRLRAQANAERLRCKKREKTKKRPAYVINQYTFTNSLMC